MNVQLKKLKLSYFKGIKALEMDFEDGENAIHGKNASGKTTVFDSLWFLFYGKDSTGRADFSIKTLDANNNAIEKVNHEVFASFEINGEEKTFQRTYKQKWSKEGVLVGHTTDYEIDGFPVRLESEYKKQVELYFNEELFKLLTNPLFFNSMKPSDRRQALITMASEITFPQVFEAIPAKLKKSHHIKALEELLTAGKNLDQIRAKAAMDKKNLKEEKEAIPNRIDEAERSKPEAYGFEELQEVIAEKKKELEEVEAQIKEMGNSDTAYNAQIQDWNNQIFEAKTKLQKLEFQAQQEFEKWKNEQEKYPREVQSKIKELNEKAIRLESSVKFGENEIQRKKQFKASNEALIPSKESEKAALVAKWKEENAKEFTWDGSDCPTCLRPLEGDMLFNAEEAAKGRFNKNKKDILDEITRKGTSIKAQIEDIQQGISTTDEQIREVSNAKQIAEQDLASVKEELSSLEKSLNEWYSKDQEGKKVSDFLPESAAFLNQDIQKLESSKPDKAAEADTSELQSNKLAIQNSLEGFQKALGNKETIERINKRITELKEDEKRLGQGIADAEGMEDACFTYSKSRVEMIENEINSKFDLVSFKLFETRLNGNETEICDTLYKGVPFQDLNNAGKIQAGLDIINTLSDHSNLYLPIFIDNRESVTWIPKTKSQLINLVVDAQAETLTIKQKQLAELF